MEQQLVATPPLSLLFAIPDHPWVDSGDGAAVRIAMTIGALGASAGKLLAVVDERYVPGDDAAHIEFTENNGNIHADLTVGANVAAATPLQATFGLSTPGVKLHGAGFIVNRHDATQLGFGTVAGLEQHIRSYRNGRDLTDAPRGVLVIDMFGLTSEEVRSRFPAVYQWLLERVKPERDQNNRATYKNNWWIHGEPRKDLRKSLFGLARYIATVETAKHRTFQFLDASVLPDNMLIAIASDDACHLGVLSSRVHVTWALAAGGTLEDRPRYNKTRCFETFPFPSEYTGLTPAIQIRIANLAEQIDAHRKRQQAAQLGLTLTGMYNVLEKLRDGEPLTAKEKLINDQGLISVLKTLHDELDASVLAAYGWSDLARDIGNGQHATATLLQRLVTLNAVRAAEEASGTIRWLRPSFQNPAVPADALPIQEQSSMALEDGFVPAASIAVGAMKAVTWPVALPEQVRAVATTLAAAPLGLSLTALAAQFKGKGQWKKDLLPILETLEALGRARSNGDLWHSRGGI